MIRIKSILLAIAQWIVCLAVICGIWQLTYGHVSKLVLVGPSPVFDQIKSWLGDGTVWKLVGTTASEGGLGYVLGIVAGVLLALCAGLLPSIVGKVIEPIVAAFYAVPKFVLVPLFFVWLGSGFGPRMLLVLLAVFPVLFIATVTGIRTVESDRVRMFGQLGATRLQVATKLLLPHTASYISTAMATAAPLAVTYAVATEILFGATNGLGGTIYTEAQYFDAKPVIAALVLATVLSVLAISIGRLLALRFTRWRA